VQQPAAARTKKLQRQGRLQLLRSPAWTALLQLHQQCLMEWKLATEMSPQQQQQQQQRERQRAAEASVHWRALRAPMPATMSHVVVPASLTPIPSLIPTTPKNYY
jgi:hypothetical protein